MIYEKLQELGFRLTDRGHYWQTTALWRDGDNQTAIKIYKDSGVWCDYVEGGKHKPFKALLENFGDKSNIEIKRQIIERDLLSVEKTYPDGCLGRLLPDRNFFLNKEEGHPISEKTQSIYGCGLATNGRLYNRIVFPIRNKDGDIHGFTGRDVGGLSPIKWKHIGKLVNWFYPIYNLPEVKDKIQSTKRVILIESVGDSMACYQSNIENNIVCFTNNLTPILAAKIAALNADVVIAFNNDSNSDKKVNNGVRGGINSLLKLYQLVDFERLWFMPPPEGYIDFGEMPKAKIEKHFNIEYNSEEHKQQMFKLLQYENLVLNSSKPLFNRLNKEVNFNYGDLPISK